MAKKNNYSIRPIKLSDSETLLQWRNKESVRKFMYTDHIITAEEHNVWLNAVLMGNVGEFKVFEFEGKPIGIINVVDIDKKNSRCYWGFYVGVDNPPLGVGGAMEFFALEYIFEELMIRKLYCEVFSFNETVLKLHKKFGFKEEGCFKEHVLKNEKLEDVVSLAAFSSDWLNVKKKLERIVFR